MPERDQHAPKHRQPASRRAPRTAVRTLLALSALALVGTGAAVAGGVLPLVPHRDDAVAASAGSTVVPAPVAATVAAANDQSVGQAQYDAAKAAAALEAARQPVVSRSDRRGVADPRKQAALSLAAGGAITRSEDLSDSDPRTIARALLAEAGFSSSQFGCLDSLWTRESGWRINADNPYSSAYGIPQALPGSKMSAFGADWATNPVTQIRWGLDYIGDRYGSPCGAWGHSQSNGWY